MATDHQSDCFSGKEVATTAVHHLLRCTVRTAITELADLPMRVVTSRLYTYTSPLINTAMHQHGTSSRLTAITASSLSDRHTAKGYMSPQLSSAYVPHQLACSRPKAGDDTGWMAMPCSDCLLILNMDLGGKRCGCCRCRIADGFCNYARRQVSFACVPRRVFRTVWWHASRLEILVNVYHFNRVKSLPAAWYRNS